MAGLVIALGLFCTAFFIHLIVWRIGIPGRQTRTLLMLFGAVLVGGLCAVSFKPQLLDVIGLYALGPWELAQVAALYLALVFAYITTYSALEVDSPSLVMIHAIFGAGTEGITHEEFEQAMSAEVLIDPRLNDLVRDGMAALDHGRFVITPKGLRIARIFDLYRRISAIEGKGG